MPCANCRKDLTVSSDDVFEGTNDTGTGSDCHAFLLPSPGTDPLEGQENVVDKIPISCAITTVFEASLKLHKRQVSSNCRLLMCFDCLSSLSSLNEAYSKFMKLTKEGSYIQQLIETSILWPTFAVSHRFNLTYDDYSPFVEVKLEPGDQSDEINLAVKQEDTDFDIEDDQVHDVEDDDDVPLRRLIRPGRGVKRKGQGIKRKISFTRKGARKIPNTSRKSSSSLTSRSKTRLITVPKKRKLERSPSLPKEKVIKRFPCTEEGCTKSFNDEKLFRRHIKFKHGNATPEEMAARTCYECPTPKIFGIPSQLRLHQREVHATETPFPCSKCDRQFPTSNRLRIHTVLKHPSVRSAQSSSQTATAKEPLLCPHNCETPFRSKVSLKLHLKSVHGEQLSYTCEVCGKTFNRSTRYRRHLKYKHGQGLTADDLEGRSCPDCPKIFETRGQLKMHQASVHSTEKPFQCEVAGCGKKFPSKNYLNIHWHMRHKKEPVRYPCEHCGKSYCSKTVLQEHVDTVHHGVKNVICEVCGKACTRQSALNRHMETHDTTRQKQFQCNICNQRFISEKTLKTHAITHSGVRDQQCTQCGDTFLHVASLRRHLHAKHGIRPTKGPDSKEGHECKQCGKVFKLKEYLSQHLRSRTHGGKGHTAQRRREAAETVQEEHDQDQEPLDGRRFKGLVSPQKGDAIGGGDNRRNDRKPLDPTGFVELAAPPLPQQIFWTHESLIPPGSSQYFRQ